MPPRDSLRCLNFMAPGILAQSESLSAICYGMAMTWERPGDRPQSPGQPNARRGARAGMALLAGVCGLSRAATVYGLARLGIEVS